MVEVKPVGKAMAEVQDLRSQVADYERWRSPSPTSKLGLFYGRVAAERANSLKLAETNQFISIAMEGHKIADENFPVVYNEVEDQFTQEQQEAAILFGHEAYTGLCEPVFYDKALKEQRIVIADLSKIKLTKANVVTRAMTVRDTIREALQKASDGVEQFTEEQIDIIKKDLP